ncbi:MAG: hypothetical protein ABSH50_22265 [Bryobacteraceae bacterium]
MLRHKLTVSAAVFSLIAHAQGNPTLAININTSTSTPIVAGFSGFNVPQLRNGVEYYDPKFVAAVTPLKPGWMRFPGGTASMAYDWNPADASGGHINVAWMNSLIEGTNPPVTGNPANVLTESQILTQAKGGVYLSDYATFAHTFGSPTVVCFNGYTDTNPNSAGLMVQAAYNAGLKVQEWELANEPYLFPLIFPTAFSYATAMFNPYYTDIVDTNAAATTGVFYAGQYTGTTGDYSSWDFPPTGMASYSPQYWAAVSNHIYILPTEISATNAVETLNGVLAYGSTDYINSYLVPLIGANTPLYITEFNCCAPDNFKFLATLYNGIFLAEYIARLSTLPNVKGVGVNSLYTDNYDYHGIIQSVNDYEPYLIGQVAANPNFSTNTATNPNTQFQFYMSAPGVALQVANQSLNFASQVWPTTVTGGPTVPIQGYDGNPVPAVYAQGYAGLNSKHHLLITNKSSLTCTATIQLNGVHVQGNMSITTVSNSNSLANNTATAQNNVTSTTLVSASPITLGPYSVTSVTW